MLFNIQNRSKNVSTHSGVLEFIAEEGRVYIPFWMQEQLQLSPGQLVTITNTSLPKGTFCKIRPQQKAFIDLADPRAVLEKKLRDFSCLTKGDTIMINYNNFNYLIDIMEVESNAGPCNAISIVEADVRVEFERPLDMPPSPVHKAPITDQVFNPETIPRGVPAVAQQQLPEEPKGFQAFTGEGRRLDGRPIRAKSSTSASSSGSSLSSSPTASALAPSRASPPAAASSSANGTPMVPVFGKKRRKYGDAAPPASTQAAPAPTTTEEEPKFKPFQGEGRSLK